MNQDNEGIPDFLQRKEGDKPAKPAKVKPAAKTPKATADKPKAKPAPQAKAKAAKPTSAKAKAVSKQLPVDTFGFHDGSLKSKAAALYARKAGATVAEVKDSTGSLQLNLLKELEGDGCKVKRVKESGPSGRSITRYFLTK